MQEHAWTGLYLRQKMLSVRLPLPKRENRRASSPGSEGSTYVLLLVQLYTTLLERTVVLKSTPARLGTLTASATHVWPVRAHNSDPAVRLYIST